ncbi:hypothetical protein Pfo_026125 [Paulownia fortunei]|nr:hypothetical protein Pfo_026125 [Paulownia fortunei]
MGVCVHRMRKFSVLYHDIISYEFYSCSWLIRELGFEIMGVLQFLCDILRMGEKKKAGAMLVRLVSAAGTGFFYVVKKTKRLQSSNIKLEFRKYDPRVNRHVCSLRQR